MVSALVVTDEPLYASVDRLSGSSPQQPVRSHQAGLWFGSPGISPFYCRMSSLLSERRDTFKAELDRYTVRQ
jgi:hypothetical protein